MERVEARRERKGVIEAEVVAANCGREWCAGFGASRPLDYSANDDKCYEYQEEDEQ